MYFVDRERIEQLLQYYEETLQLFLEQASFETRLEKLALERIGHLFIESIVDVGNAMIDGFIMRDPGSYEDIIDILLDEKVINEEDEKGLKKLISFRKPLVQEYMSISHGELKKAIKEEAAVLQAFPDKVRSYLENELGPVSAFRR
ncbi:DUF86 domain-containing protein [Metabacillus sp. GX 13764]|uniref:DUF86 domain-containing protein n=1 Tax=Metabacillus kandeliae TaxID=2900151 RepID=UPI001E44C4E8|nr:DUF86 domain-containing protein [Metabacillus kandeliae]MCD7036259.1 DUF86 domain-containing protein [Metabacillus kandeliae]